jgi:epoxyqueuosine reductase
VTPEQVGQYLIKAAKEQGFHRVGLVPIDAPNRYRLYRAWLAGGHSGTMTYLTAPHQLAARRDLRVLAQRARTVVVVALAYPKASPAVLPPSQGPRGFVARYARGADYHLILRDKLMRMANQLSGALGRSVAARPCVDSAPVLERDLAEAAGLGFVAKNTMLIAPGLGSYTVLGELLLDVDATAATHDSSGPRCGSCRACLDACPTAAFVDAYVLDARRCISYLTIEHRGVIDRSLRSAMGTMIFGCDICQEVCPYNAAAPDRTTPAPELEPLAADRGAPDLIALLSMSTNQLRRMTARTALRRASRVQLMRNVCVALGNAGDTRAIPALARALRDRHPLVRGHAAWALGQLGAAAECQAAMAKERDAYVRRELQDALAYVAAVKKASPPRR